MHHNPRPPAVVPSTKANQTRGSNFPTYQPAKLRKFGNGPAAAAAAATASTPKPDQTPFKPKTFRDLQSLGSVLQGAAMSAPVIKPVIEATVTKIENSSMSISTTEQPATQDPVIVSETAPDSQLTVSVTAELASRIQSGIAALAEATGSDVAVEENVENEVTDSDEELKEYEGEDEGVSLEDPYDDEDEDEEADDSTSKSGSNERSYDEQDEYADRLPPTHSGGETKKTHETDVHQTILKLALQLEDVLQRNAENYFSARAELTQVCSENIVMHRQMHALLSSLGAAELMPTERTRQQIRLVLGGQRYNPGDYEHAIVQVVQNYNKSMKSVEAAENFAMIQRREVEDARKEIEELKRKLAEAQAAASEARSVVFSVMKEEAKTTKNLVVASEDGEFVLMHAGQKIGWFITGKRRDNAPTVMIKTVKLTKRIEEALHFRSEAEARECLSMIRKKGDLLDRQSGINPKALGWYTVGRVSVEYAPPPPPPTASKINPTKSGVVGSGPQKVLVGVRRVQSAR